MKHIHIESCYANSLVGYGIALSTKQPFSHTATIIDGIRYEALMSKGYVKNKYFPRVNVRLTEIPVTEEEYIRMRDYHEARVGSQYPNPIRMALSYVIPAIHDLARQKYCSQEALSGLRVGGLYGAAVIGLDVPRPHPGIVFSVAEALKKRKL